MENKGNRPHSMQGNACVEGISIIGTILFLVATTAFVWAAATHSYLAAGIVAGLAGIYWISWLLRHR
jgi:hypothetical protein